MREIFYEAILQQSTEVEEDIDRQAHEDMLTNFAILNNIDKHIESLKKNQPEGAKERTDRFKCPICRTGHLKDEVLNCKYHLAFAYKMNHEDPLVIVTKSKQRGGPSRLLGTELSWHLHSTERKGKTE